MAKSLIKLSVRLIEFRKQQTKSYSFFESMAKQVREGQARNERNNFALSLILRCIVKIFVLRNALGRILLVAFA